MPLAYKKED